MWEATGFSTRAVVIAVRCAGPGKQLEVAGCCPQQRSAWRSDWEVIIAPRDPVRSRQRKTRFCSRRCSCPVVGGTPSPSCTLLWRIDPCGWSHLTCGRSHRPHCPQSGGGTSLPCRKVRSAQPRPRAPVGSGWCPSSPSPSASPLPCSIPSIMAPNPAWTPLLAN